MVSESIAKEIYHEFFKQLENQIPEKILSNLQNELNKGNLIDEKKVIKIISDSE